MVIKCFVSAFVFLILVTPNVLAKMEGVNTQRDLEVFSESRVFSTTPKNDPASVEEKYVRVGDLWGVIDGSSVEQGNGAQTQNASPNVQGDLKLVYDRVGKRYGTTDGNILVRYRPGTEIASLGEKHGLTLTGTFGRLPVAKFKSEGDLDLIDVLENLRLDPAVTAASLDVNFYDLKHQ